MRRCRHGENNAHPACNPYTGKAGLFTLSAVQNASLYEWDNLIPKAFWRGNDFWFLGVGYKDRKPASAFYLHRVLKEPSLRRRVGLMRAYLNPPGGGERKIGPRTAAVFQSLLDPDLVDAAFFRLGQVHQRGGARERRRAHGRGRPRARGRGVHGEVQVPPRRRRRRRDHVHRDDREGASHTLVPVRPRSRGERRSLRTFPGASLRPPLGFNPRPRRLSTPPDAYELHPDIRSYGSCPCRACCCITRLR